VDPVDTGGTERVFPRAWDAIMAVSVKIDKAAVRSMLLSPSGPVGEEIERVGKLTETSAQIEAPLGRSRRAALKKSITMHGPIADASGPYVEVGSDLPYAEAVHEGRPAMTIFPRQKKALWWRGIGGITNPDPPSPGDKRGIYANTGHPVPKAHNRARPGNPFLIRAIERVASMYR
jgi:hypothetical protein